MAIHFCATSGAISDLGPKTAELDTTTTVSGSGATNVFGTTYKVFTLLKIVVRKVPTAAAVVTIKSGSTSVFTLTVPTSGVPPYDFGPQGIPLPSTSEIKLSTTNDADLLFIFDVSNPVV